jgi:hypothetical protein
VIKVADSDVIFINKNLKIFNPVARLLLLASAPINTGNCYERSCGSRRDFYRKNLE